VRERFRLSRVIALFAIALIAVGCATSQEPAEEPAPAEESAAEPVDTASILADPTRPADEVAQDGGRKAVDAYAFFGVEPGMTVADVWTGAGYNTHLLSRTVADGKVFAILGLYAEGQFAQAEQLAQRVGDAQLDNVEIVTTITDVPAGSLDVAVMVRNFHDADAYGDGRPATVAQLFAITKPGGIVGIIDVATPHEGWHEETHRLNEQAVIDDFVGGGFELVDSSDMLRNADDDHSTSGFQEGRHTMDRYVLKFRRPAGN